jgi:hypothetical protein
MTPYSPGADLFWFFHPYPSEDVMRRVHREEILPVLGCAIGFAVICGVIYFITSGISEQAWRQFFLHQDNAPLAFIVAFLGGIWHGFALPLVAVCAIFMDNVSMLPPNNDILLDFTALYWTAFVFGIMTLLLFLRMGM